MIEELTAKMHGEFEISHEKEKKLTAFIAIKSINEGTFSIDEACRAYGLSEAEIQSFIPEFEAIH